MKSNRLKTQPAPFLLEVRLNDKLSILRYIAIMDPNALTESIQLALAPVFLLTAVAGMITALTHRLSRVIDRSRLLQKEINDEKTESLKKEIRASHDVELGNLARRGRLIDLSMILLVLCAIQIGLTVLELFFAENSGGKLLVSKFVLYTFVGGIASFVLALISLLSEVLIASYSVRWRTHL